MKIFSRIWLDWNSYILFRRAKA